MLRTTLPVLLLLATALSGCAIEEAPDYELTVGELNNTLEPSPGSSETGGFDPNGEEPESEQVDSGSGTEDPVDGTTEDPAGDGSEEPSDDTPAPGQDGSEDAGSETPPQSGEEDPDGGTTGAQQDPGQLSISKIQEENRVSFKQRWGTTPSEIRWWFGDGETSTSVNPTHTYAMVGTYDVFVRAKADGFMSEANTTIVVTYVPLQLTLHKQETVYSFDFAWGRTPSSILWDFGDGNTSAEAAPTHEYTRGGPFTVKLTVSSPEETAEATEDIVFEEFPLKMIADRDRTHVDYSFTWGWTPDSILWDLGDGSTSTEAAPSQDYPDGGGRNIVLTVTHGEITQTISKTISIPTYGLSISANIINEDVQFAMDWDLEPTSIAWNFGDPTRTDDTSAEEAPSWTYEEIGEYTITLQVSDDMVTRSATLEIEVANMEAFLTTGTVGLTLSASVEWPVGIESTSWNFGDGTPPELGTATSVTHRYGAPGAYTVQVIVSNGEIQQSASKLITVNGATEPDWGEPEDKDLRPGMRSSASGGCTTNFLFHYHYERFFFGSAAHCAAESESNADLYECGDDQGWPLGSPVELQPHTGTGPVPATLAYNSWTVMTRDDENDPNTCLGNDFALYEITPEIALQRAHPAMLYIYAPEGLRTSTMAAQAEVYGYGASSTRDPTRGPHGDSTHENAKRGNWVTTSAGDWLHEVNIQPTSVPGDSGSGLVDGQGRALGVASTVGAGTGVISGSDGTNAYVDIAKALEYMAEHEGWAPELVTWEGFTPPLG